MNTSLNRRSFIRNTSLLATTLAMPTILPRNVFGANEKLNIATIGAMGKGQSDTHNVADLHNIVALVDADMNRAEGAAKALQSFYTDRKSDTKVNAKLYTDFRKMFDAQHSGIDAVIVSTPASQPPCGLFAIKSMWLSKSRCVITLAKSGAFTKPPRPLDWSPRWVIRAVR